MLIFNDKLMTKAKCAFGFYISDDAHCLAAVTSDNEAEGAALSTEMGDEVWIFKSIEAADKGLFVYFPNLDYATTVSAKFIKE